MDNLTTHQGDLNTLIASLASLQKQAELNFMAYSKLIYQSKVRQVFSHLFTPTYEGCFVKLHNLNLDHDEAYVDLDQEIWIERNDANHFPSQRQMLWSMTNGVIVPFEVNESRYHKKQLEVELSSSRESFSLSRKGFRLWFVKPGLDNLKYVEALSYLKSFKNAEIRFALENGEVLNQKVSLSFGCGYTQHQNQSIRQNLIDPRLQSSIYVEFEQVITQNIKSMSLIITHDVMNSAMVNYFADAFLTNLFPMANQKQVSSEVFVIDGHQDIYWLSTNLDEDMTASIHEVLGVFAEGHALGQTDYTVIYQDQKVGLQFNKLSGFLGKKAVAELYISIEVDQKILSADPANTSVYWHTQQTNAYNIEKHSQLYKMKEEVRFSDVEMLIAFLNLKRGHVELSDWEKLFEYFDYFSVIRFSDKLKDIQSLENGDIHCFFPSGCRNEKRWYEYYLQQIENFLNQSTHFENKLIGVF